MNTDTVISMFYPSKNNKKVIFFLLKSKKICNLLYRTEIYMKNVYGTMVVWLQNNVGFTRWRPTESRVEALLEAFRPVREKERDKLQQDAANHSGVQVK